MVNNLNTDEESFAPEGHLIDDVKRSLQQLENATVSFIPSGCNQVAHILAKHALNCNSIVTRVEEVPLWLESFLVDDTVVSS